MNSRLYSRLAPLALCLILVVAGCAKSTWTYRLRLTIEIETPEGVRTGSSVVEVTDSKAEFPFSMLDLSGGAVRSRLNGEAAVVDLGSRGVVFVLLGVPYYPGFQTLAGRLLDNERLPHYADFENNATMLETLILKAEVPLGELPMLVRFKDLNAPSSMTLVDPKNLAASFGDGVRLKRATIETTRDQLTTGIEKRLPWLSTLPPSTYVATGKDYSGLPSQPLAYVQADSFKAHGI